MRTGFLRENELVICSQNIVTCYEVWESVTIQIRTIEQYFTVELFIMLYKVVLTSEFVVEISTTYCSDESY